MSRGHTCVVAGAGAGKTRWLVEHYLGLLHKGLEPSRIVAITFTEKAATEMRERITTRVLEQGGGDELLAGLELACISTIHSFCVGLLREFALLVGLEPGFDVLEEGQFLQLVNETLEEVIAQALAQGEAGIEPLLEHYSLAPHELPQLVRRVYIGLLSVGVSPSQAQQVSAQASKEILREFISAAEAAVQQLRQAVEERRLSPKAKFSAKVQRLVELWPWEEGLERLDRAKIEELMELVGGRWGEGFKSLRASIKQALEVLVAPSIDDGMREGLLGLVNELWVEVERKMREVSGIGFAHQLLLTLRLLEEREDVLAELRGRYEVILVDEFQDTDPIQARIVGLLTGLEGPPGPAPALVIVGDPAQSIYSFRGAQAHIFGEMARRLTHSGGRLVQLKDNYRSCRELVELFNSFFSVLELSRAAGMEELGVDYCQSPKAALAALGGRAVEVVDLGVEEERGQAKLSIRQRREAEAEAVARYVLKLKQEGVSEGDIVILMRQRTGVEIYEQALAKAGIRFYTVGGRGFFVAPEVRCMVAGLRALVEPADEAALLGWLRSIFVGLDEEVVVALGVEGGSVREGLVNESFWPRWASPIQRGRLARARQIILSLEPIAHRLAPAQLLERLLEEADAEAVSLGGPRGEQAAANLRKLIELVRAATPRVEGGTRAVVQWLQEEVERALDSPDTEAQAPLAGEHAQVVRIMSVHQAKGLEFPVVLLVDLGSSGGGRHNSGVWIGRQGEVALKIRDPLTGKNISPPLAIHLQQLHNSQQAAENLRLFYVACTRATSRLVFFLSPGRGLSNNPPKKPSWAWWVKEHVLNHPAVHTLTPDELPPLPAPGPPPAAAWKEFLPPEAGPARLQAEELIARCSSRPPEPKAVGTTVSALEEWFACPRRWWLAWRAGLDLAPVEGGERRGDMRATVVGSTLHALLELADFHRGPEALELVAPQAARAVGATAQELARALALAKSWFSSPLQEMFASAAKVDKELELLLRVEGEVALEVKGAADLVLWGKEEVGVVDYKLGGAKGGYELQMRCYAMALAKASGLKPRAWLAFFSDQGLELVEVDVGEKALGELEGRLKEAAQTMAQIEPWASVDELPVPRSCPPTCPGRFICRRPQA